VADLTAKIAEVTWEDSQAKDRWSRSPLVLPMVGVLLSVGYVVQDDDAGVVLVESWNGTEEDELTATSRYGAQTAIPRSAIRKVEYLRGRS